MTDDLGQSGCRAEDPFEYRSVFDGYRASGEFHDWTDHETAQDEADAFRGLGCKRVRIVRRRKLKRCPACKGTGTYITMSVGLGSPHICPQCHGKEEVPRCGPERVPR